MPERTSHERETLIFQNPEGAQQFRERVEGRLSRDQKPGIQRQREALAEEIATEFEREGEGTATLKTPWEHTLPEHEEVQRLVNTAFAKDLKAAIKEARQSSHYPRNLDLLHDVLTGEMYKLLTEHKVNKQTVHMWVIAIVSVFAALLLFIILLFFSL